MPNKNSSGGRRSRRSPEQMIQDLQNQIEEVRSRATAKELKQSPSMKRTIMIVRSLNKALQEASKEKNTSLRHALADAHKPLAVFLESQGVKTPKARMPRGRRPQS